MADGGTSGPPEPKNWCFRCSRPLYEWQPIYSYVSLVGRAVICSTCAPKTPGAGHATWRDVLVGAHDIPRWKK